MLSQFSPKTDRNFMNVLCHLHPQGSGVGTYAATSRADFNNGQWHFIRVVRIGNMATLEDEAGRRLAAVEFGQSQLRVILYIAFERPF